MQPQPLRQPAMEPDAKETRAMESQQRNHDARAHALASPASGSRMRGITMIETLIVLAVVGIFTVIGMPTLRSTLSNTHTTTISNRLLADLSLARSEAIMRSGYGEVCPSSDGSTCNGGIDWSDGWIVFLDRDQDKQRSPSETVLSAVSSSDLGGFRVATSVGRTKARFRPDGRNGGTNLSLRLCDGAILKRRVVINISGRSRIDKPGPAETACE